MKDLILQFFQARSFPELAAAVRSRASVALTRWENAVKEILPSADELTHAQLRNSLPETLDNLALALESTCPFRFSRSAVARVSRVSASSVMRVHL